MTRPSRPVTVPRSRTRRSRSADRRLVRSCCSIWGERRLAAIEREGHEGIGAGCTTPASISDFLLRPLCLRRQAELFQQRFDLRLATAEIDEGFHGVAAAALLEDGFEETTRDGFVEDALFFERAEGIRSENFCPLVAVIASCVAARKN